jgi:capsular polysaccharide biosynthesis protein
MEGWRQLDVLRDRIRLIVATTVLAGLATFVVTSALPKQYEAQVRLLVGDVLLAQNPTVDDVTLAERLSLTYSVLATTRPVAERVIAAVGINTKPELLLERVSARAGGNTPYVAVTVRAETPALAALIANEFAHQLQLLAPTQTDSQSPDGSSPLISVVEPAVPPDEPASPRVLLFTLLSLIGGAGVGVAVAFGSEFLRPRVRSARAAAAITGLPALSIIPRRPVTSSTASNQWTDVKPEFHVLRTNLIAVRPEAPTIVLITAANAGEGTTTVATGLAAACAASGSRVIVVDATLGGGDGLSPGAVGPARHVSRSSGRLQGDVRQGLHPTSNPAIQLVTATGLLPGRTEPAPLAEIAESLQLLAPMADIVIVDGPAVASGVDAAMLGTKADATILVVDLPRARRRDVELAAASLVRAGVHVAGIVVNRTSTSRWAELSDSDPAYGPALDRIGSELRAHPPAAPGSTGAPH